MIKGDFHGLVGAKAVRLSGHHSNFVVETFDRATGNLSFSPKPLQQPFLVRAQHWGDLWDRERRALLYRVDPVAAKCPCVPTTWEHAATALF